MKHRMTARSLSALLAGLLLLSASACGGATVTSEPDTSAQTVTATEEITTAEIIESGTQENGESGTDAPDEPMPSPSDTPKDASYVTTSDLTLPAYTYDITYAADVNNGILPSTRDVFADTWTATDDVGRSMPTDAKVYDDSQIGMFYFLWRDADQNTLNPIGATDHYKAYLEGGIDKLWEEMQVGGEGHPHYWAEPYFGYYSSNDEWVLRKHAYMFAEAGVDFLFFDTTNNNIHERSFMALFKVWEEVKQEGYHVPKLCFICGGYTGEFNELWNKVYSQGLYEDLWFYWGGKPLIMFSGDVEMTEEQKDFFTTRLCWAYSRVEWYTGRAGKGCWLWNDLWPQAVGKDYEGNPEQIVIMCGYGANGGWGTNGGRSYSGKIPFYEGKWDMGFALMETTTGEGALYEQHFKLAMNKQRHQPILMITGWNEWIAGRWSGAGAGAAGVGQTIANEYIVSQDPTKKESTYFVDQFNPEYSRDLEPMKGGFGDNYFYQTVNYIRQYKGAREVQSAFGQWAIDIEGSVGQWYAVGPEYRDYEGDITHRKSPGHVGGLEYGFYENYTGRNDIVTAKVSTDSTYVYFYVECADDITTNDNKSPNWMNLFIDADCNNDTGWYGYDFIVNRAQDGTLVSIEKFIGTDQWEMETVGSGLYTLSGNVLQIKLHRSAINFNGTMDFKWADNSVAYGSVMEFIDLGDAAPNDRFNYRFTLEDTSFEEKVPECMTDDMVILRSRSYNAFVGKKQVRLVEDNTMAVTLCSNEAFWLPVAFVESTFGISCEGQTTYNHYGVTYVQADALIRAAGKTVTVMHEGTVIISDAPIEGEETLRILSRVLS
ncbi:MAG: hypothetical protein J6D87_01655 [Clostridia bacterium]|nr:hypothetical protein [Clostridia bacterium]